MGKKSKEILKLDFSEEYELVPHNFKPMGKKSRVPYLYCVNCGLLSLKNDLTEWATSKGCDNKYHPSYRNKLGLTNPFK
jgi:hypothetical protein